jgi:hypothetical protein
MDGESLPGIDRRFRPPPTHFDTTTLVGLPADMRSQKEWAAPQRQFRMPAKKVAGTEQTEETRPQQKQADMERYLLQIDRQTSPRKSDA